MPYPPHDFQCPYRNACPHLEWLSAKWALEAFQRAEDSYDEHLNIIDNFYNSTQDLRNVMPLTMVSEKIGSLALHIL